MKFSIEQLRHAFNALCIRRMRGIHPACVYLQHQGYDERFAVFVLAGRKS